MKYSLKNKKKNNSQLSSSLKFRQDRLYTIQNNISIKKLKEDLKLILKPVHLGNIKKTLFSNKEDSFKRNANKNVINRNIKSTIPTRNKSNFTIRFDQHYNNCNSFNIFVKKIMLKNESKNQNVDEYETEDVPIFALRSKYPSDENLLKVSNTEKKWNVLKNKNLIKYLNPSSGYKTKKNLIVKELFKDEFCQTTRSNNSKSENKNIEKTNNQKKINDNYHAYTTITTLKRKLNYINDNNESEISPIYKIKHKNMFRQKTINIIGTNSLNLKKRNINNMLHKTINKSFLPLDKYISNKKKPKNNSLYILPNYELASGTVKNVDLRIDSQLNKKIMRISKDIELEMYPINMNINKKKKNYLFYSHNEQVKNALFNLPKVLSVEKKNSKYRNFMCQTGYINPQTKNNKIC